jgi:hypothetical protein
VLKALELRQSVAHSLQDEELNQSELAMTEMVVGNLFHRLHDRDEAIKHLEASSKQLLQLTQSSDEPLRYAEGYVVTLLQLSGIYRHQGNTSKVVKTIEDGTAFFNSIDGLMLSSDILYIEQMLKMMSCELCIENKQWLEAYDHLREILQLQVREKEAQPDTFDVYSIFLDLEPIATTITAGLNELKESLPADSAEIARIDEAILFLKAQAVN